MIGLAFVMMRVRRAHAITIFLLGTLAIAAAVAPAVYVRIAQRSVAAVDVATATPAQRTIVVGSVVVVRADPGDPESQRLLTNSRVRAFDRKVSDALRIPGFDTVFTVSVVVDGGHRRPPASPARMKARSPSPSSRWSSGTDSANTWSSSPGGAPPVAAR